MPGISEYIKFKNPVAVQPYVYYCGPDSVWDANLRHCVPKCPAGFHWDDGQQKCVVNTARDTFVVITNSNNPDDYVGFEHNEDVNQILGEISLSNPPSDSELLELTIHQIVPSGDSTDANNIRKDYSYAKNNGYDQLDLDSLINLLYLQGKISYTAKTYLSDLSNLINNIIGTNDPQSQIYYAFANQALIYENQISQLNLSASEKDMLLSAFAVARYSAAYWGNAFVSDGGSSFTSVNINFYLPILLRIHINWKKLISKDVKGFITGIIRGLFSGSFDVLGGIAGGVLESVGEFIDENSLGVADAFLNKARSSFFMRSKKSYGILLSSYESLC